MSLKEELSKKIPTYLQSEPEFKTLLELVQVKNISEMEHLLDYLKKEIEVVGNLLQESKGATAVKSLRDKTIHLEVLKKCQDLAQNL
ncbi:hypothetical protein HOC13_01010 [Candidatus Woesearchaeota archaeon]|jgi:hypothetical protein|nr:hypothetical protein [Candidatus Woesearchaeota archaeon]